MEISWGAGGGRTVSGALRARFIKKKPFRELSTSPATSATGMPPGGRRYLTRRMKCSASEGFARLESHLAHLLNSHTLGNRNRRHGGDLLARKLDDILLNHAGARERRLHAFVTADRNTPSDTSAGGLRGNRERHLDESGSRVA